jgi:hypothetical protein
MSDIIVLEVFGVLLAWMVAGYAIWKWGPGKRHRFVRCPESGKRAEVLAVQSELEFGCLRVIDVAHCSLVSGPHLDCPKTCLTRL